MKLLKIINENDKRLRTQSSEVVFPLTANHRTLIRDMIKYLENSQTDEIAKRYDLKPGMGLAACQVGIMERFFVIVDEDDEGFIEYVIINPKIISHSEEEIYVNGGEECLSVDRDVVGIIPRYARMTVEYQDMDGNTKTIRVKETISIAFQHEIDHLNGILFVDKIDKKNPFKNIDKMREL